MKKQYPESVDVARVALWLKETKSGKMFLSGFLEFNDETKVNVRIFKSEEKRNENSPDYFGSGSVNEEDEGLEVALDEYVSKFSKKTARKSAPKKSRVSADDVPF